MQKTGVQGGRAARLTVWLDLPWARLLPKWPDYYVEASSSRGLVIKRHSIEMFTYLRLKPRVQARICSKGSLAFRRGGFPLVSSPLLLPTARSNLQANQSNHQAVPPTHRTIQQRS